MTAAADFSRPVRVDEMTGPETVVFIDATADERAALATRLGLVSLDRLVARMVLVPTADRVSVKASGTLSADVVQSCVVTLDPVRTTIEATLERVFSPAGPAAAIREDEVVLDAADPPEPIEHGVLDLGPAIAEQLALDIDPFPRASGARFAGFETGESQDSPPNPFAVLKNLKRPDE